MENLLPSPDSAFQLGDLFPMVKVKEPVIKAAFGIISEIGDLGGFILNTNQ